MADNFTRRNLLRTAAAGAALVAAPAVLRGQEAMPRVRYVTLATGFNVVLNEYMAAKRFDLKRGVNIDVVNSYTSVSNYYNDLTAGTFDLGIGAWDTFAARYMAGVPLQLVCTVNDYDILHLVSLQSGPGSLAELAGRTIGATLSSGAYRITKLALRDFHKIDLEGAVKVQNVESPAAAVTMVLARNVDAGLTWEPNISVGVAREPALRTIYNLGQDFQKNAGFPLPYFGFALRKEAAQKHPGVGARIAAAIADCIDGVAANLDEAIALAAPKMRLEPAVLKAAFTSGRLVFRPKAMDDAAGRKAVVDSAAYLARNGALPRPLDDGFFA
ncbi:MAG: hypothetical protein OHK0024_15090 [Thalassobaculales bacterium]